MSQAHSRDSFRSWLPLWVGCIVAAAMMFALSAGDSTNFAETPKYLQTSSYFATHDGKPIHCSACKDAVECIAGWKSRGERPLALWFGNSQLHAVNQLEQGDRNAPDLVAERLRRRGADLLTFSQPNANLQEHYVLLEYLLARLPVRAIAVPLVFDDTRENGLRDEIALALEDTATRRALEQSTIGNKILTAIPAAPTGAARDNLAGVRKTLQEHSETFLETWLNEHSMLWRARPELRGRLFMWLYQFRNTALNIRPASVRHKIRGPYEDNMAALAALLNSAKNHDVSVLLYIAPIRNDVAIPYDPADYAQFKLAAGDLARTYGAKFVDLEHTVGAAYWGYKDATDLTGQPEVDYMHFKAAGHHQLAEAIEPLFQSAMKSRR